MVALPPVVCPPELPAEELQAARLDGEVYVVGLGASPIDIVEAAAHRASALKTIAADRMIAELHTAAWIWGAIDAPPHPLEFCVGASERTTRAIDARVRVREVVLDRVDWVTVGGLRVTSPLRTIIEIARVPDDWTDRDESVLMRLVRRGDATATECRQLLERSRNLPHKRRAWRRITDAISQS